MIDVKELIEKLSIKELNAAADQYFRAADIDALLMKPFNDPSESPEVLACFFHILKGMSLPKGSKILDYGCGSAWSSRLFAAFGYDVVAVDVSPLALRIGAQHLEKFPLLGRSSGSVEFLLTDGMVINLADDSVDAVVCLSSFHHVVNTSQVLSEFYRVLKPYGVAAFSEPGPNHSKTAQSQHEMQNYLVIENDIIIEEIWGYAKNIGFSDIELGLYYPEAVHLSYDEFHEYISNGGSHHRYKTAMFNLMIERRLFFMEKGLPEHSFNPENLDALIVVESAKTIESYPGESIKLNLVVKNTGSSLWRPSAHSFAPVRIGPSIVDQKNDRAYIERIFLPAKYQYRPGVKPGDEFTIESTITAPIDSGDYRLTFQLVSEYVKWFGNELQIPLHVKSTR